MPGVIRHLDETGETILTGTPASYTWPTIYPTTPGDLSGTADGGAAGYVILPGSASAVNGAYRGFRVGIISGTGAGQVRTVGSYTATDRKAFVTADFTTPPDNTSVILVTIARRFCIQNVGDEALPGEIVAIGRDGSNGGNIYLAFAADADVLIPPYKVSTTVSAPAAGGVWPTTGPVYYRITATLGSGETVGSFEVSAMIDDLTQTVTLAWTPPAGSDNIKVYRSDVAGTYTAALLTTEAGGSTGFVDDGSAVGAGDLPAANTTGAGLPFYGTPPTLGTAALTAGTPDLEIGQQFYYWAGWRSTIGLGGSLLSALVNPATS